MKTYYKDFADYDAASRYARRRSDLGHNTTMTKNGWKFRLYFSAGQYDFVNAVEAPEIENKKVRK